MAHARQQIRSRVASTTLSSLASSTGSGSIYESRTRPVTQFPAISVYNGAERLTVENPSYINSGTKRYRRFFDLMIEVAVKTNSSPDDALDALCVSVEEAMAGDDTMGGGVIATDLLQINFTRDGEGDDEIHTCRMAYTVEYRTDADDVETFLS